MSNIITALDCWAKIRKLYCTRCQGRTLIGGITEVNGHKQSHGEPGDKWEEEA